ncbi:MAG TPA: hypothetical protein VJ508_05115, partial [Saprospiraceae bacterium]|nr:hypothetical protein [Saprospiraceae bacterium]
LRVLSGMNLPKHFDLVVYYEMLLFMGGYPGDARELRLVQKEIHRITAWLKAMDQKKKALFDNTGMPFTETEAQYSHDGLRWLSTHPDLRIVDLHFQESILTLNDVLRLTLPSLERSETTAGMSNEELLHALGVGHRERVAFLIRELDRYNSNPLLKDHLFDKLSVFVRIQAKHQSYSKAYNRLQSPPVYFHHDLLRKIEFSSILSQPIPPAVPLNDQERYEAIQVVKNAMAITARETDPTTFMMEHSFRLYHLDRGFSVAIYDMIPARQLPLESYIGYTAFKNGYPAAYGGAWVFGEMAIFGLNIFESFRSGESAYCCAQLLHVYQSLFNLRYFEIEPYQFGLDNPEGIASGAFWFYYRLGFRSLDPALRARAEREAAKIKVRKGYRSGPGVLTSFTGSNLGLKIKGRTPPKVIPIMADVSSMIKRKFKGDRLRAETICLQEFMLKTGFTEKLNPDEQEVIKEMALWAAAHKIEDSRRLNLMKEMIRTKPVDVFQYQAALRRFFSPA